ncbi:MAG: hypothetical protein ACE5Q3_16140, partial [Alphaproteobacteria bacterium]
MGNGKLGAGGMGEVYRARNTKLNRRPIRPLPHACGSHQNQNKGNSMNKRITFLLVTTLLAFPTWAMGQSDQTYATYITEEQWQTVNELPGVDRQIVSRDIGK